MAELILKVSSDDGVREIAVEGDHASFGRGSGADYRFQDEGLSRLHATIYREGDRVWIVDENSSNGSFVNGGRVAENGTPLHDGDRVTIGNSTVIDIEFRSETDNAAAASPGRAMENAAGPESGSEEGPSLLLPLAILAVAVFVVGASAVVIGVKVWGNSGPEVVLNDSGDGEYREDPAGLDDGDLATDETGTDANEGGNADRTPVNNSQEAVDSDVPITDSPKSSSGKENSSIPAGKRYQQMTDAEKNQYVKVKAEIVSRVIGNSSGQSIPPAAVARIRYWLDGYVRRIRSKRNDNCSAGGWVRSDLLSVLERARKNAPFIIRAFNEKGIDPQVGLYLAMIESEHCQCLQSHTGPLGMFQFTYATAKRHGLNVRKGASPSNSDERCEKEPASRAAASYMKSLTGRIGTGSLSIPLAIASYNSGEGGLGKNLKIALEANQNQERSFWTLVANSEKLAKQFQKENIKYVPKFFAAAIIGENPKDFGINMLPLSVYTK